MNQNYTPRQEMTYYDANKTDFITRNMDVAAYLELKLGEVAESQTYKNQRGETKAQFVFANSVQIRDLLEIYDRGEALVEPKAYSEVKMRIINARKDLLYPKAN